MTDQIQSLRDDLDYMKALAREGRQAPILGGVMLLVAGVAFAAASFVQYAALKGWVGIGPDTASLSWLVAMGVFVWPWSSPSGAPPDGRGPLRSPTAQCRRCGWGRDGPSSPWRWPSSP